MQRPVRHLVPLLGLLLVMPAQRAAAQSISFGVLAGASLSTFTGDLAKDARNNAGLIAGAFVRIGAMGFAVQPGIYYTAKGAKSSDFSETGNTGNKTTLDYIQIPLVLRIKLGPLYVGAGPALGIKLKCLNAAGNGENQDCGASFGDKNTEISGIAEGGLEFGKFSLGLRADLGLTNALEAVQSGSTTNLGIKTQTISAVAMIRF